MNPLSMHTKAHLRCMRDSVMESLAGLRCVTGVGVFGSFATGRWDEWSDLDLLVECDDPIRAAHLVIAEIHARIPILCHSPFTTERPGDGRYWFRDYSPFH
jgi:predicted nucleotidyltransferase